MDRIGPLAWPSAYYSVQVKSTPEPWKFTRPESVEWLIKHPLPVFLCIVDKPSARLRVYHTSPRYYAWSLPPLPQQLELVPEGGTQGQCTQWEGGETFSLSAPILDFSITDTLTDDFQDNTRRVLKFWLDIDDENLFRVRAGVQSFKMPADYRTNSTQVGGWVVQGITEADDESVQRAVDNLKEPLAWITAQLYRRGGLKEAIPGALLLRNIAKDDHHLHNGYLHRELNKLMNMEGKYLYAGIDGLDKMIRERLKGPITGEPDQGT